MKHSCFEKWEDLWQSNSISSHIPCYSLYVSNLPSSVNARDLKRKFETIGNLLSVNVILDPKTGRSRGYGFVDYSSDASREEARSRLHNTMLYSKKIRVSRSEGKCTLYVGNLPTLSSSQSDNESMVIQSKLEELSGIPVKRIRKRKNYNYGFVEYDNHRQAQAALVLLRNARWNSCDLRVEVAASDLQTNESEPSSHHHSSSSHHAPRPSSPSFGDREMHTRSSRALSSSSHTNGNYAPHVKTEHSSNGHHSLVKEEGDKPIPEQYHRDLKEKRRTLYIKNLDKSTTDEEFKRTFEKYGKLTRCLIIRDVPSRKLNYGFIQYESQTAANEAYHKVHGRKLNGVTLHIEFSKSLPGERKKRLITTLHKYQAPGLSPNDERNQDLHWTKMGRRMKHSASRSRSRSRSSSRSLTHSASRSRSRSVHERRRSPSHSSSVSRHSKSRSSSRARSKSKSKSVSKSPSRSRSRSRSRHSNKKHHRHRCSRKKRAKHNDSSSSSTSSASPSPSGTTKVVIPTTTTSTIVNVSDSNRVKRSSRSHSHHHKVAKPASGGVDECQAVKSKHVVQSATQTLHQRCVDGEDEKLTMCVNLPVEYDLKRMEHLIGFDTNRQRYILFGVEQTSSSLSKLQTVLSKKNVRLNQYHLHHHHHASDSQKSGVGTVSKSQHGHHRHHRHHSHSHSHRRKHRHRCSRSRNSRHRTRSISRSHSVSSSKSKSQSRSRSRSRSRSKLGKIENDRGRERERGGGRGRDKSKLSPVIVSKSPSNSASGSGASSRSRSRSGSRSRSRTKSSEKSVSAVSSKKGEDEKHEETTKEKESAKEHVNEKEQERERETVNHEMDVDMDVNVDENTANNHQVKLANNHENAKDDEKVAVKTETKQARSDSNNNDTEMGDADKTQQNDL